MEQKQQSGDMPIMLFKKHNKKKRPQGKNISYNIGQLITNLNIEIQQDLKKIINR